MDLGTKADKITKKGNKKDKESNTNISMDKGDKSELRKKARQKAESNANI